MRRHPYSVVLFDEIEKAHPDIFHLLLQILDEGILTDANGRKINFKNTLIIMTSNVGAKLISNDLPVLGFHEEDYDNKNNKSILFQKVMGELKRLFQPEFLNRVDEIILFRKLSFVELEQIVVMLLEKLQKRLEKHGYQVTFSEEVISNLAKSGEPSGYGARPLKRAVRRKVEDFLADAILAEKLVPGCPVKIICKNDKISMEKN